MIRIKDLQPGDIIILTLHGSPHVAIYSPIPGAMGDLIQMGYGIKRSGAIKSTLAQQVKNSSKDKDIHVVRHKKLNGTDIAAQAEFWLRQGVVFDEKRLSKSWLPYSKEVKFPSKEVNLFEYLKFAARRETAPIKTNKYPFNYSSMLTLLGVRLCLPNHKFNHVKSKLGRQLIKLGTARKDRPKGLTCVGFVLACVAAVALKDEIMPVSEKTGWVSLKYCTTPTGDTAYHYSFQRVRHELHGKTTSAPGLHDLLTDEQKENFDTQRLFAKLTPLLANLNPHQPSEHEFFNNIRNDSENWEDLGSLDKTSIKPDFDKEMYQNEIKNVLIAIGENREKFKKQFGEKIFQQHQTTSSCRMFSHSKKSRKDSTHRDKRKFSIQ